MGPYNQNNRDIPDFTMLIVSIFQPRHNIDPAWISYYIHYQVWDEMTCPFQNLKGAAFEVWEWTSKFIPHFTRHVITYPWCIQFDPCWTDLVEKWNMCFYR